MLRSHVAVLVDVDLGEERLVAQAPVCVVAACVDLGAVLQEVEGIVEVESGVGVLAVVGVDAPRDLVEFAKDAVLFPLEDR
ncbi:hypothetical protein [Propionibacterium freudenreichii]|uniref:hypothetical protein n=1 Tax=Propionibacterium freudenreichii TaxID=1744 RepID=UPI0021A4C5E5|nr:hypothetical protein [Propionibacterium freudenreichii]